MSGRLYFIAPSGHYLKYALMVWFAVMFVKVKLVIAPLFAPSTITLRTSRPAAGVIV